MMRLLVCTLLLAPGLPHLIAQIAAGHVARQTSSGSYSISGVIANAGGAPLDRADVTLARADQQDTQIAEAVTGETGSFRFDNLAAGKYRLDASRRGYLTAAYEEHEGGYFTAVVTGPGLDSQGIQFRLLPESVIGGAVTDDSGESVGGAQVTLYRIDRNTGISRVVQSGMQVTDDTGAYEFPHLKPGTYYVAVSASPWYAVHTPLQPGGQGDSPEPQRAALDVAYPMTFYANATDSDSATPIALSGGDHQQINISLHAVPAVHIQIRLPGPDNPSKGFTIPQLAREVFGNEQYVPLGGVSMTGNSTSSMVADLGGVAPGDYVLRRFGPQGEQGHSTMDVASTQVVDDPTLGMSGVDVTGKVEMANGAGLPSNASITLVPSDSEQGVRKTVSLGLDGSFALHAIAPGTYDVQAGASGHALAILQMAASGAEVKGSKLTVGNDAVLLAGTLVSGATTLSGYARQNGRGVGGALILLIPADPTVSHDLSRLDQSDSDGSFELNRVFPGTYTLVAINGGWTLDWARPDVIAPYLARGIKIRVSTRNTIEVPEPVEVQSR